MGGEGSWSGGHVGVNEKELERADVKGEGR